MTPAKFDPLAVEWQAVLKHHVEVAWHSCGGTKDLENARDALAPLMDLIGMRFPHKPVAESPMNKVEHPASCSRR